MNNKAASALTFFLIMLAVHYPAAANEMAQNAFAVIIGLGVVAASFAAPIALIAAAIYIIRS